MKVRVLSIGRRIAIAVCAVLALTTGTLSVIYPRLAAFSAAAAEYDSISVESHLSVLEKGLNEIDSAYRLSVWDQLESSLTVKGIAGGQEVELGNDEFAISEIVYNANNTATITVKAGEVTNSVSVPTADAEFGGVVVEVNSEKAVKATWNGSAWVEDVSGIWKVKKDGAITDESVFLTDLKTRPVEDILGYLTVSLQYQNVKVPVTVVSDGAGSEKLGNVNTYRIRQKSFVEGNQTVEVSVSFPYNGMTLSRVGILPVTFEDAKVIRLDVTQKSGVTLYSYSDVTAAIDVVGHYNDGREAATLNPGQYTTNSTLLPSITGDSVAYPAEIYSTGGVSGSTANRTGITNAYYLNDQNATVTVGSVPGNVNSETSAIKVEVFCDDVEGSATIQGVTQANLYQIIGIIGVPATQSSKGEFDLSGLTLALLYAEDYKDVLTSSGTSGTSYISGTQVTSTKILNVPLETVKSNVEISVDGAAFASLEATTLPEGNHTVELRYTYKGQMFYYATGVGNYGNSGNTTCWVRNANSVTQSYSVWVEENTELPETHYYTRPVIDCDDVSFRSGLSKSILGVNFADPNSIAHGTVIVISNGTKSIQYTYRHVTGANGVATVEPVAAVDNNPSEVGVSYNAQTGVITVNKPGNYTVTVTMPEEGENNWKNYWYGTLENSAVYEFIVEKGDLSVSYTNVTLTASGLTVPMGSLVSTLNRMGVLFSTGGNIVFDSVPDDYEVYIRKVGETAWHAFLVGANSATRVDTAYVNGLSQEDKADTHFEIYIRYSDTDFYNGNNTYLTPVTLSVLVPDISTITEDTVSYDNGVLATAENVIAKWQPAVGDDYTITVQKDGQSVSGELHAGEYQLVFTPSTGDAHIATLRVTAVVYGDLSATNESEIIYADFTNTLSVLKQTAAQAITAEKVYYVLNESASVRFVKSDGTVVTEEKDLTAGNWTAQFETTWANADEENDYNCPTVSVTFTVTPAEVNLAVDTACDFSSTDGTNYTSEYNSGKNTFAFTGWTNEARANIAISVTGRLHREDGTQVTIPSNFISMEEGTTSYKITFNTAGVYTVTVRLANELGNVTGVTEKTYTLTIDRINAAWNRSSYNVLAGTFSVPAGVQFFTNAKIGIAEYTIYDSEEGGNAVSDQLAANTTYYLEVERLTGDYVISPDGLYSATYTYAENYNLPVSRLKIEVSAHTLDALVAGSDITGNSLSVTYGQSVDILSYFTNAVNAEAYIVTVSAATRASLAEQLAEGTLPVGTYTVTIDANIAYGYTWASGASATQLTLDVTAQELAAPELTAAQGTYNGEAQTVTYGAASYWSDYNAKGVVANVYWSATALEGNYATNGTLKANAFNVANGTLIYTDAGYYYIVFSLGEHSNYAWTEESETELSLAQVAKLQLALPYITRVWTNSNPPSYAATGTRTIGDYVVSYSMVSDLRNSNVTITMTDVTKNGTAIDIEGIEWVENELDTDGRQYLEDGYGTVDGHVAKLNFAIVNTTLDVKFANAEMYYGGYLKQEGALTAATLATLFPASGTEAEKLTDAAWVAEQGLTIAYSYLGLNDSGDLSADLTTLPAGKYIVSINFTFAASSSYQAMSFSVEFTVVRRPVTIKVDATKKYNEGLTDIELSGDALDVTPNLVYALDTRLDAGATYTYADYAWVQLETDLANYVVTFDDASTLKVEKGTAEVYAVISYVWKGTDTPTLEGTVGVDDLYFSEDDVNATGTARYMTTYDGLALYIEDLSSENYNLLVAEGKTHSERIYIELRVTLGSASGYFGIVPEFPNIDDEDYGEDGYFEKRIDLEFELEALNTTLTDEEVKTLKEYIKPYFILSTDVTATSVVGTYPIHIEIDSFWNDPANFVLVEGEYTVLFDIATLNVKEKEDLAYTGEALELVELIEHAALNGVNYTVYYSVDADHEHWSTFAQGINAGSYKVAYCIDIAGFDRIYARNEDGSLVEKSVTIAFGKNTLKTPFDLTVGGESKVASSVEDLEDKIAWTYGNFNGVTVTTPTATFGGAISFALYKEGSSEPVATGTDINALLALHANRLSVGTYYLNVTTSDAANYDISVTAYYFAIGKAAITFKADDVSVTYGENANYSYSVTGLNTAAGDTKESILGNDVKVTFNCDYVAGDAENGNLKEGGYVISLTVSGGADGASLENYTFETADGVLTVVAREITIKIDSITVDYRATQQDNGAALETLTAQLVRGSLPNGVQLTDVIDLLARGLTFNKENGELISAAGVYPIYALWKNSNTAKNYVISFFDCEYAEAHDYSDYIGGGAAHTAGLYTINRLFVNTTWSSATRSFVYNGSPIYGEGVTNGLTASSTGYVDKNGVTHSFTTARPLTLTYEVLEDGEYVTGEGAPVNAGTYRITANLADPNYTTGGSYIIIQIDKATLEIKVDNATMTYGDALPTPSYTIPNYNALLKVDQDDIDGKTFTYAVEGYDADYNYKKLPAGTHVLTLAGIELKNYNVVVSYGSLTVNRREVTVTLNSFSQPYKGSAYDQDAFDQLLTDLAEKGQSPYTVTNMPENGDLADNDTLGITLSIAGNALNVNTYTVVAGVTHNTNYLVTLANTSATFTITPADIYVQTTLKVIYGETTFTPSYEIGTLDSDGAFVAGVNGETYQKLYNDQQLLTNVVYVGGAPEYALSFTANAAEGSEYTANRLNAATAKFTFMNYNVLDYLTVVEIEQRVLTMIGERSTTYTGSSIVPNISFGNVVAGETIMPSIEYFDANDSVIAEMINAGNYYLSFKLTGSNASRYAFNENGDTTIKIAYEVLKKVIDLRWDRDSIQYDDTVSDSSNANDNILIGFDAAVADLVNRNLTRVYTVYSTSSDKGQQVTDSNLPLMIDTDSEYFFYRVRGVGSYTITIALKEGNSANYSFAGGENEIVLAFSAYANSAKMTVTVEENKIYDGNAAIEEVTIEGPAGSDEEIVLEGYLTKTYALISADVADELIALDRKINSNDIRDKGIIFATSTAPVDAGYYVLHVVYFRELSSGSQGADTYVVYSISSRVIDRAPELDANTVSYVYNAQPHTFIITVTDEAAIMAFGNNTSWIGISAQARDYSVTVGTTPYVDVTTGYTVNAEVNNDGTLLTITVTALNAGNYTVTFHIGNNNFVWNVEEEDPDLPEGGSGNGIVLNENGDVTISFSVLPYQIVLDDETGADVDHRATVDYTRDTENYLDAIKYALAQRGLPSFVNVDSINSVVYHVWREDDNYAGQNPVSGVLNVGTYHYSVKIPGTTNYNSPSLTGTLVINKKTVEVYVNAFTTFGSEEVSFDRNSFTFEGFVNGENVWTILSDIFDGLIYHVGTVSDTSCYSNGYLNAGTYEGILTLEMDENGNIIGFVPSGLQDNYIYHFAGGALTVNSYQITVNIGNASSPFGTSLTTGLRNVLLTTGSYIFEPYTSLRDLLAVRLTVNDADSTSNAGNYVITATAGNANYQVIFNSGVYTITPVAVSITLNAGGGTYNGTITGASLGRVSSAESPDLTRADIESYFVYRYTGTSWSGVAYDGYEIPTLAGSYTVTAEIDSAKTGNFTLIGSVSAVFEVARMQLDVNKISVADLKYNGSVHSVVLIDNDYNVGGALLYTFQKTDANAVFLNAGTYSITLTIRDADNMQWSTREGEYVLFFNIAKGDNSILDIEIDEWTYGEAVNQPKATVLYPVDGMEVIYEYYVEGYWTTVAPTNAGTYRIRATVAETENYLASVPREKTFVIHQKSVSVPMLDVSTSTYTGNTLLASVLGYDASCMTLEYSDISTINNNTVTLSATNAGTYVITIKLISSVNYKWAMGDDDNDGTITLRWTVVPKTLETDPTENTDKFIVDGSILQYIPTNFDPTIMDIKNNEIGHSGKFTVTVSLKDKENYRWSDGSTDDITFEWTVEGVSNIFIGIVCGLVGVVVIATVALIAQVAVHNNKKKREAAEMENRDSADNAEEGV